LSIPSTYLQQLTVRLGTGVGRLAPETRELHGRFLKQAQHDDGGFAGRMGESDLYYTSFALRALAILGELHGEVAQRARAFLRGRLGGREPLIDHISLVFAAALLDAAAGLEVFGVEGPAWKEQLASRIIQLRREDGGFAKGPQGAASSTYFTFLALLGLELINHPCPDPAGVVAFIRAQRDAQGGFREIRVGKRAGTNPTAAAIGVLRMLDALDKATCQQTAQFLADMQDDDGGLLANARIPIADVLSTFTGLLTLCDLGELPRIDLLRARRFAQRLEHPRGGFLAAPWDESRDVEYTFYGLGCLALLAQ